MFSLRGFIALLSWTFVLVVSLSLGSEIINGKEVQPHSLPFMALLETTEPDCGGTLIDLKWVLTAAHCTGIDTVILGVHSIKAKKREEKYRQVRKVIRRIPHFKYNKHTHVNDLMLLQLDKPVKLTKSVNVLKLKNHGNDPKVGSVCLVAGWGTTDYDEGRMSDVLMSVKVTVVDRKKCNSPAYYNNAIYPNMMCAGSNSENVADTCQGDSGGPIICNGAQAGVTSFGKKCGIKRKPGVYTLLTEDLLNWIRLTMRKYNEAVSPMDA